MKLVKDVQLRRYTPPTCTLELWQSRHLWQRPSKTLPPDYRFLLSFDDPRLPDAEQLTLSGTSQELEALAVAVETYLQKRLSPFPQEQNAYPEPELHPDGEPSFILRPQGNLSHELLGLGAPISLSTSQLYDLMLALESFRLQDLEPSRRLMVAPITDRPVGFWLGTAVAVGGFGAIAIAGILIRQFQPQGQEAVENNLPLPVPSPFQFNEVSTLVPPPPRANTPSPQLGETLALRDPLPHPSAVVPIPVPARNANLPLVVPPTRVSPPDLQAPPPPGQTAIVIPDVASLQPLLPPEEPASANALAILPRPGGQPLPYGGQVLPPTPDFPALPASGNPVGFLPPRNRPVPPRSANLLDTIPQVGEVRQFYQRQWQPSEGQTQTLEYRLQINPDGMVQKTVPLGRAASLFMAQLPQPAPGEPLVSPLGNEKVETIRLVLTPLGDVKAFLED